ncbi:MAG: beta-ketoacyl synthase N-terminal-like domain-containing protein, partial [Bacillota bacterium]|nr:beta-ketoacyl synthase N-terminal-like domain-containing protein [Bacillota bacterium]
QDLANQLLDRCSCLWNVYGPTETTIWSTMVRIEEKNRPVIIGKPIANTEVYILDNTLNLTPVGIPGELYIGGDGLARGYLHLPELTKEKFILSPFSSGKEKRLYKTGDLVRYMPDGSIEFVGRIDHQVKIRGFRIELGEVETVLNQNSCIRECVVLAREVLKGEKSLVAYIIPQSKVQEDNLEPGKLREYLKGKLPDYMIPSYFVIMDSFPMTPNGKIDRKAMPLPQSSSNRLKNDFIAASNEIEINISKIWKEVLGIEAVGMNDNFFDLGGHSLLLAKVRSKMAKEFKKDISMLDLFNYPTIKSLAKFIEKGEEDKALILKNMYEDTKGTGNKNDIAIVGLSARVPGAKDIDQFWKNLCDGVESITTISDDEIMEEGISPELLKNPNYVKAWGVLEDVDKFDARFFGYNPREAIILDPQQRIFLEESWKALENAGYDSEKFKGLIGTFASVGMNTYINNLSSDNGPKNVANNYQIMINNDKDFLATRVSYKLNLEGPGLTVQTACSSSLVAVHLACQSLINGECDMALAGGVSIRLPQKTGYIYQDGMILSPDGHCRAFDENARGTIGGNGAGVVVLKRLKDAIEDGDTISAVIKGSAINNDGNLKVGYTAPRVEGQASAIAIAQRKAGVDPQSITYIETHGTGTPLGDPIEMEALNKVFGKKTEKKLFCAIGSVKTNVGHLDSAAGVTGLIKTVLALKNKIIPPSLNFERPNPKIDFHNSPFYVNTNIKEWKSSSGEPLRAGISSFGIGGTNAHVVLEEGPLPERSLVGDSSVLLV